VSTASTTRLIDAFLLHIIIIALMHTHIINKENVKPQINLNSYNFFSKLEKKIQKKIQKIQKI
jgi:hypothetical protein